MLDRNPLPCPPTHLHLHASRTTEHILAPPHIYTYLLARPVIPCPLPLFAPTRPAYHYTPLPATHE